MDEHSQPTGTRAASTVLTAAILQTDLEEVPLMSEKQFLAEKLYYISIAKSMLEKGIIDRKRTPERGAFSHGAVETDLV